MSCERTFKVKFIIIVCAIMDVFQIESSNISSTISECQDRVDEITEVKFEAHSEFDLNFFETPDDSMTQCSVFSNPNSVESLSASPEPLTPNGISVSSTTSSNVVTIKNGKKVLFFSSSSSSSCWLWYRVLCVSLSRIGYGWGWDWEETTFLPLSSLPHAQMINSGFFLMDNARVGHLGIFSSKKILKIKF